MKKNKKNSFRLLLALLSSLTVIYTSCKRQYDSPPIKTVEQGKIYTIKELKALYNNSIVRFTDNASLFATVTSDEKSGNFYKTIFIQDSTGALQINLLTSGGVYIGDSVRIALKGTRLLYTSGMFQLDSVSTDNNIFKQSAGKTVMPKEVTLTELQTVTENLKGRLVKINNVQFTCTDVGLSYSDAVSFSTVNRTLEDCNGKNLIVRTSGYAKFAGSTIKKGKGSITGIITVYNTTPQLYIRDLNDVNISDNDADRCAGTSCNFYLKKDFEDNSVTSGGWSNINVSGNVNWNTGSTSSPYGSYYGVISNYSGGSNNACETWLISPSLNLTGSTNPILTFQNATKYSGPALEVYVSIDYVSGPVNTGSWTLLSPTLSTGNFSWTSSGNISLASYKSANTRIAFKYTGGSTNGATWEIDNIIIKEP
jgi:hypothetical protein